MSLATASCDLWQNEQRRTSSLPVLVLTEATPLHYTSGFGFPELYSRPRESGRSRAAPVRTPIVSEPAMGRSRDPFFLMHLLKHNYRSCAWLRLKFKYNF